MKEIRFPEVHINKSAPMQAHYLQLNFDSETVKSHGVTKPISLVVAQPSAAPPRTVSRLFSATSKKLWPDLHAWFNGKGKGDLCAWHSRGSC